MNEEKQQNGALVVGSLESLVCATLLSAHASNLQPFLSNLLGANNLEKKGLDKIDTKAQNFV